MTDKQAPETGPWAAYLRSVLEGLFFWHKNEYPH